MFRRLAWIGFVAGLTFAFSVVCPVHAAPAPAFPLRKSDNGRYLVDQHGVPFLIAGESPQAMTVNLSEADAELFLSNRKSHGFNTVWINLLCRPGTGGRADGSTYDGILPFKTPDDFSTPNEAYFARCDRILAIAERQQFLVILDPCETIDHLKPMVQNGPAKCRAFGRYLGERYKRFANLLWMSGNDFYTWSDGGTLRQAPGNRTWRTGELRLLWRASLLRRRIPKKRRCRSNALQCGGQARLRNSATLRCAWESGVAPYRISVDSCGRCGYKLPYARLAL